MLTASSCVRSKPVLIFTWGNPARGDDALGSLFLEQLLQQREQGLLPDSFDSQMDFQLQIEHILDLKGYELILFADAALRVDKLRFEALAAAKDSSFTSHALSPSALLHTFVQVTGKQPPPAFLLQIGGVEFELGKGLSHTAKENLHAAVQLCRILLDQPEEKAWRRYLTKTKADHSQAETRSTQGKAQS